MADALTILGLNKKFDQQAVLSEVSFNVNEGEFFGLVGLNGAGKSTLIKCLLDFCSIESGTIRIFGKDHTDITSRSRIAYLPERFTPPYYLTGRDFLVLMSELHNHRYDETEVSRLLNILDLEKSALSKPVYKFSKGMGQKLGLLSCLVSGKNLLVFDEPMSGLDPRAMSFLKKHLLTLRQEGYTLFFSTHILVDIEALCDRMAILHKGKIRYTGSPAQCKEHFNSSNLEQAFVRCVDTPVENFKSAV